jgi:hypothetical protein
MKLAKHSTIDRYGKFIKKLTQNNSWDGMLNGHEVPLQIIGLL